MIEVGVNRNRYIKYGLPSRIWVQVCSFLHPEGETTPARRMKRSHRRDQYMRHHLVNSYSLLLMLKKEKSYDNMAVHPWS